MTIFTIGHGRRTTAELVGILQAACVDVLVDVRQFPASRTNPQFNSLPLARELSRDRIKYVFMGKELGGRRGESELSAQHRGLEVAAFRNYAAYMMEGVFVRGIQRLLGLSRRSVVCIMCAETLWYRCHRRMISDYLMRICREEVMHLGVGRKPIKHAVWRVARRSRGVLIYDKK
jgi:uncharacterized protein (DUF488 family)